MDFLTRLGKEWSNLGLKGLPLKPLRSLVSPCPLMSHCNLRFSKMTDGKRLSTQQSPNIVAGPICLYLLPRLSIKLSKLPLSTHRFSLPMRVKGWKSRPTMPLTKEKPLLPLPHPQMTLINLCPPTCIWEMIALMWLVKLGLKAPHNLKQIQKNQKVIAETRHLKKMKTF